jgi:hypothetical protein
MRASSKEWEVRILSLHDGESGMENAPKVKCGLQWAHHLGCVGLCSFPLFPRVKVLIADGTSLEMVGNHTWKEWAAGRRGLIKPQGGALCPALYFRIGRLGP